MFDTATEYEVIEHLDFDVCEGRNHPLELYGHNANAPVVRAVIYPCGGSYPVCEGWAHGILEYEVVICQVCADEHLTSSLRFVPIPKGGSS